MEKEKKMKEITPTQTKGIKYAWKTKERKSQRFVIVQCEYGAFFSH